MPPLWKQAVETVFTAFAVPLLLVPLVWLGTAVLGRRLSTPHGDIARPMHRLQRACAVSGTMLVVGGLLAWLGVPLERLGRPLTGATWVLYGVANLLFSALIVRMTAGYGALPDGTPKDALFLRFLGLVVLQPVATAGAFSLLYRLMGLVYREKFP